VGGISGVAAAAKVAARYGLIPPDSSGIYGPGETLTYAAQRLLTRHSMAREFTPAEISAKPFANEVASLGDEFKRLQDGGFLEWRLKVDGTVATPMSFSVADLATFPKRSQITEVACEEGWSYIAEWTGVPLSYLLDCVGVHPQTKYVVYRSFQPEWWESIDMADGLHPQTLVALRMNGENLPVPFGGPVRMRVPRQLGYKSVKYLTTITLTDDIRRFGKGLGSASPEAGYAWYGGI
jgi:DMSO/TMAO reductase YedYZ molybdopterin-dependent catalytic subunit